MTTVQYQHKKLTTTRTTGRE